MLTVFVQFDNNKDMPCNYGNKHKKMIFRIYIFSTRDFFIHIRRFDSNVPTLGNGPVVIEKISRTWKDCSWYGSCYESSPIDWESCSGLSFSGNLRVLVGSPDLFSVQSSPATKCAPVAWSHVQRPGSSFLSVRGPYWGHMGTSTATGKLRMKDRDRGDGIEQDDICHFLGSRW